VSPAFTKMQPTRLPLQKSLIPRHRNNQSPFLSRRLRPSRLLSRPIFHCRGNNRNHRSLPRYADYRRSRNKQNLRHCYSKAGVPPLAEIRMHRRVQPGLSRPCLARCLDRKRPSRAQNDQVELRFSRVRVIGTKEFAFGNSDQRQIKRMPLREIERLWLASESDGNMFHESPKLSLWRFAFLLRNVFQVRLAHVKNFSIYPGETRLLVAIEKTAIPAQIKFTNDEG